MLYRLKFARLMTSLGIKLETYLKRTTGAIFCKILILRKLLANFFLLLTKLMKNAFQKRLFFLDVSINRNLRGWHRPFLNQEKENNNYLRRKLKSQVMKTSKILKNIIRSTLNLYEKPVMNIIMISFRSLVRTVRKHGKLLMMF